MNLTDASGTVVASYSYDTWGNLTSVSENTPTANGWVNPFRFDGRDGVRYDASTGLDWMSVRAYDPSVGRFLSRDPLGRAPLFFADQPYAYAGNNPLANVDPSGQYRTTGFGSTAHESWTATKKMMARVVSHICDATCKRNAYSSWLVVVHAQQIAAANAFHNEAGVFAKLQVNFEEAAFFIGVIATVLMFTPAGQPFGIARYGAAAAFGTLAYVAYRLSDMFNTLGNESAGTNSVVGWFTRANLVDCFAACFFRATGLEMLAALGVDLVFALQGFSQLGKAADLYAAGEARAAAAAAATTLGAALVSGVLIYGWVTAGGLAYLSGLVGDTIQQQENAAWS